MAAKQNMTDREYMDDILLTSKTMSGLYHYAVQESPTESVHTEFKTILNQSLDMQHEIYSLMEQKGWYTTTEAPTQQVDQVKNKFSIS
ncbi:MAG: spore coat protein [Ruminococcaceae bacterium]|nr:spore coat protein [Oscillospiraceae bacterium]